MHAPDGVWAPRLHRAQLLYARCCGGAHAATDFRSVQEKAQNIGDLTYLVGMAHHSLTARATPAPRARPAWGRHRGRTPSDARPPGSAAWERRVALGAQADLRQQWRTPLPGLRVPVYRRQSPIATTVPQFPLPVIGSWSQSWTSTPPRSTETRSQPVLCCGAAHRPLPARRVSEWDGARIAQALPATGLSQKPLRLRLDRLTRATRWIIYPPCRWRHPDPGRRCWPLARIIHQRRMACPDPTRIRRQIARRPPQASLGRSVEEAGA
jgi:hypothetical protein